MGYNPIFNDNNEMSNPAASPIQPTPPYGPERPGSGGGQESEGRPFSLNPKEGKQTGETPPELPSPMEIAGDTARQQQPQIASAELSDHIANLKNQLTKIRSRIQDPALASGFSSDHFTAMQKVTDKMTPDMQAIAKHSNGKYLFPQQERGQPVLEYISRWIDGSQTTLQGALEFLQTEQRPNPADYLRLQYAVQRATQKGELFASIIGSTVSGVKTLMSTQLG